MPSLFAQQLELLEDTPEEEDEFFGELEESPQPPEESDPLADFAAPEQAGTSLFAQQLAAGDELAPTDNRLLERPATADIMGPIQEGTTDEPLSAYLMGIADAPTLRPLTRFPRQVGELIARAEASLTGRDREPNDRVFDMGTNLFRPTTPDEQASLTTGEVTGDALGFAGATILGARQLVTRGLGIAYRELAEKMTTRQLGELSQAARVYSNQRLAEATAAKLGAGFAEGPFSRNLNATRAVIQRTGRFFDNMGASISEQAAMGPRQFAGVEASLAVGGTIGGVAIGSGQESLEDAESAALGGSIIGSIINIPRILLSQGPRAAGFLGNMFKELKSDSRRIEAAVQFENVARRLGTTSDELLTQIDDSIRRIDELAADLPAAEADALRREGRKLPVGTLTGNSTLLGLERAGARRSLAVRGQDEADIESFTKYLLRIEERLRQSGNPDDLRTAAALREQAYDNLIKNRLIRAQERALESIKGTIPESGGVSASTARRSASETMLNTLDTARKDMRKVERELYTDIAGDQFIPGAEIPEGNIILPPGVSRQNPEANNFFNNIEDQINEVASELGEGSRARFLNSDEVKDLRGYIKNGGTVAQLMNTRSAIFDRVMQLGANNSPSAARRMVLLGESLKESIDSLQIEGLDVARQFSRQLNRAFTDSFAGDLLETARAGGFKIEPELALAAVFRGGDASVIRLRDIGTAGTAADIANVVRGNSRDRNALREAVQLNEDFLDGELSVQELRNMWVGFDNAYGQSIMDEAEFYLKGVVADFTKPDGTVDVNRLTTFVRNNQAVFEEFPDIRQIMSDPISAARHLENITEQNKVLSSQRLKRRLFGGILGVKNPVPVLRQVITSSNRTKELDRLAKIAKDNGQDGIDGLSSSILTAVYDQSRKGDHFRFTKYRDLLMNPSFVETAADGSVTQGPSLLGEMRRLELLEPEEIKRLEEMLDVGVRMERAMFDPTNVDDIFTQEDISPFIDAGVAILGSAAAREGARSAGITTQGNLIIPAAGAKVARKFFIRNRAEQVNDIILEATSNADFFRTLMREVDFGDQQALETTWDRLDSFLISAGLHGLGDYTEEVLELPEIPDLPPEPANNAVPMEPEQEEDFFQGL